VLCIIDNKTTKALESCFLFVCLFVWRGEENLPVLETDVEYDADDEDDEIDELDDIADICAGEDCSDSPPSMNMMVITSCSCVEFALISMLATICDNHSILDGWMDG
jgi:hypothetical protein